MDTRDGRIYRSIDYIAKTDRKFCVPMAIPPTQRQRERMKVGRNENCPCGSGRKFKKCCMMRLARGEVTQAQLELASRGVE